MGTRADFYVGRGPEAEWLGSIAYDGDPNGTANGTHALEATDETAYRELVGALLDTTDHATRPAQGWPWPWDDSRMTDFAYAFDGGQVWGSVFGHAWFKAADGVPDHDAYWDNPKVAVFPDMSARKNVTYGRRSGAIVVDMDGGFGLARGERDG